VILGVNAGCPLEASESPQLGSRFGDGIEQTFDLYEVTERGAADQPTARCQYSWASLGGPDGHDRGLRLSGETVAHLAKPGMMGATSSGWRCDRCTLDHRTGEGVALRLWRAARPQPLDQPLGGV
jgi:hypothetical protein